MAEGGCEKFPDHWNPEFSWTIIVEYLSHRCPVDILVKRWVTVGILFPLFLLFSSWMFSFFIHSFLFKLNNLTDSTFYFLRIFLSYKSRKLILESELSTNLNPSDSCGCAPNDGSFPKASDPTCESVRRQEVMKVFVVSNSIYTLSNHYSLLLLLLTFSKF